MSNMDRREALRGLEVQTFDLLAEILPSEPWAVMLNFLLRAAAANGKRDLAQKLVRAGAEIGDALHEAVGGRHPDVVNDLLECGASIDTKDSRFGMSPLHFAREADIVQLLLLKGADKDAVDSHEYTPLYIAIHFDREAAALALLAAGAIVTLPCGAFRRSEAKRVVEPPEPWCTGQRAERFIAHAVALDYAASCAGTHGAADVDLLLRWGADETIADGTGNTALGVLGSRVEEQSSLAGDAERVRELLANAPIDRAWRRRGYLALCGAHPDRVEASQGISDPHRSGVARRITRSGEELARANVVAGGSALDVHTTGDDWVGVVWKVHELQEEGIFRTIVGFL